MSSIRGRLQSVDLISLDVTCDQQRTQSGRTCDTHLLVPAVRLPILHVGRHAFLVADARTWNDLPVCVTISTVSSQLQKTTKTASVSTFISWPGLTNQLFLYVVLVVAACYLGHLKIIDWLFCGRQMYDALSVGSVLHGNSTYEQISSISFHLQYAILL